MAMRRRKLVLVAAASLLGIAVVLVGAAAWWSQSRSGLEFVRGIVERQLAQRVAGSVHVGALHGSLLGGSITIDSIEMRDANDAVLVATGPVSATYALSDLVDRFIVLRDLRVERPLVHLRQDTSGAWNFRRPERPRTTPRAPRPPRAPGSGPQLGDIILVESLKVVDGVFRVTDPWRPDSDLRGAARDSAIRHALARADSSVRRVDAGFMQTRSWTDLNIDAPYVRLRYPDSSGVTIRLARLDVVESNPPFDLRDAAGTVRVANDTVHLAVDRFRLPGSVGSARGTVVSKDGLALDIRVVADTVSLADVAWLMPTFPTDGSGTTVLDIRKPRRRNVIEYSLSRLDVRTTHSRLKGAMTFGVGGPVLALTKVDLEMAPIDFRLIERFSGAPLAMPWAGELHGRVRGPGGPLDRFIVDEAAIEFRDGNVPGIVNRFRGSGELDILRPAFTAFHDFALGVEHLDFRTLIAVNPKFPPLVGTLSGTTRLDSVWTDVRFRGADLRHATPSQPVSRFLGDGRVTLAENDIVYDVAAVADPISLDALAVSYPTMPLRGTFSGPLRLTGSIGDLGVNGELSGEGGRVVADLRLDALEPTYRVQGKLDLFSLDPSRVLDSAEAWRGDVTASVEVALGGDSLHKLDGGARVQFARSQIGDVRIHTGRAQATFGGGLMRVDTAVLETSAARLYASGGLGLSADRSDSLRMEVYVDSVGGLRPFLVNADGTASVDSLGGSMAATAYLRGSMEHLDLDVNARGREIIFANTLVDRVAMRALLTDVLGELRGDATIDADAATLGGMRWSSVHVDAQTLGTGRARVGAQLRGTNRGLSTGALVNALTSVTWDSTAVATRLETLGIAVGSRRWRLARPGLVVVNDAGLTLDSLELIDDGRGRVLVEGTIPHNDAVRVEAQVDALSLADVGELLQTNVPVTGFVSGTASLTGTRAEPRMRFDATAVDAQVGEARVEGLHLFGTYGDRLLRPTLEYRNRDGGVLLTANAALPLDLALTPVAQRRLDAPLQGTLVADSAALEVIETFSNVFADASGRLNANLTLGGTWTSPLVTGRLAVVGGNMALPRLGAVRLQNVQARVRFFGDSLRIDTLSAQSGETPANRLRAFGGLRFADLRDPYFEEVRVIADRFRMINKPGVADLEVSGALRLVGPMSRATLSGADTIVINRNIYIPDAVKKDVISLDDPEFFSLDDTAAFANRRVLPSAPARMLENLTIENVTVAAGPNLWLRSNEANIQLGGALQLRTAPTQRRGQEGQFQLALDGALFAQPGGTYRLNLGVIQKTFIVESGTIRFFGQPDLNPTVDISALHTVRQYDQSNAQQDVRIRVSLEGTLARMTASLSSPDSLRISNADLISYLATGRPDFGIGGRASDYAGTAARIAVSSLGSVLSSSLAGGLVDVVDVRTAGLEGYSGDARAVGGNILAGTRIGGGKQLGERGFLRADFGLCQVGQVASGDQSFDPVAFANSVGVKWDYRISTGVGVSLGLEPPTSALLCASGNSARGFVPTPRQWGFDLFRLWRF